MRNKARGQYPDNWREIAAETRAAAGNCCVRCGHVSDLATGYLLTVHHLDGDKGNCRWYNIPALCQRCHLSIQGRVDMDRPWVWEHTVWFKPYVAGHYAKRYLGLDLTRAEVEARLDELLDLERIAVLGTTWKT